MIYMTSPIGGAMHVYSEGDAVAAEKMGWVRSVEPTAADIIAAKTLKIKRGPGRPRKVDTDDVQRTGFERDAGHSGHAGR